MEQDALKSAWEGMPGKPKDQGALKRMMQERNHPALKRARRQLIIEAVAFGIFVILYYDLFDGDRKPVYANVLLVAAVLLTIGHNLMGYLLLKRRIKGDNLKRSLEDHLHKIKAFAVAAVAGRALTAACLLIFFASAIAFSTYKYWLLAGVVLVFAVQMALLAGLWKKRISELKGTLDGFSA
jgi:hypothetical protein